MMKCNEIAKVGSCLFWLYENYAAMIFLEKERPTLSKALWVKEVEISPEVSSE